MLDKQLTLNPGTKVLSPGACGVTKSHYNLSNNGHSELAERRRHHKLMQMEYYLT